MVPAAAIFYALLFAAAFIWIHLGGRGDLLFADLGEGLGPAVAVGLAAGGVVVAASILSHRRMRWARALEAEFRFVLGRRTPAEVAILALLSGTAEEVFFRGAMQPVWGIVWTSLIFGGIHFVPRRVYLPWTVLAIVVGFLFGGIYELTGNLYAPITAHVLINSVNLWRICGAAGVPTSPAPPTPPVSPEGLPPEASREEASSPPHRDDSEGPPPPP